MGRGLDGYLISVHWRCVVLKVRLEAVSTGFRWLWRGGNTSSHSEQSS